MGFNINNGVLRRYREEDGVTEAVIPDGVTSIGSWTFYECTNLKSIKIPDSVKSIEENAFSDCTNLISLTIGAGISTLENVPIYRNKLKEINVSKNNCVYLSVNGVLFNKTMTELIRFPQSYIDTEYTIPESVTRIKEWAFSCCKSLTDITMPNGVTSIERRAFNGCTSLVSINIPESITSIGENAFYECTNLESITIPDSVTSIERSTFLGCESLKNITIPDGVTSIGRLAFNRGTKITFTENFISYTIKLEDYWNYNSEEKRLNNFVFEKDNAKRQEIFTEMKKASYKIPLALFMMFEYDDEFFKAYVKKSFAKVMTYIIDNDDMSMLLKIFETGFLTKKNIDKHINYADGKTKLQKALIGYKQDNFK